MLGPDSCGALQLCIFGCMASVHVADTRTMVTQHTNNVLDVN